MAAPLLLPLIQFAISLGAPSGSGGCLLELTKPASRG
jgi:hypothetical protein